MLEAEKKNKPEVNEKEEVTNQEVLESYQSKVEVKQVRVPQNDDLKCDMCEYRCKKKDTLKKHMNTKHNEPRVRDLKKSDKEDDFDKSTKFRCYECKEVVSLHDKFNEDVKENQMCELCTMTAEYGK